MRGISKKRLSLIRLLVGAECIRDLKGNYLCSKEEYNPLLLFLRDAYVSDLEIKVQILILAKLDIRKEVGADPPYLLATTNTLIMGSIVLANQY